MHRTFSVPRLFGWSSLFALLTFSIGPSAANAQQPIQPVSFAQATPDIQQTTATVTLTVGTTQTYMMTTKGNLKKVENPNSKVLDVRAIPKVVNEVQLIAVGPGRARVTFTDVTDKVEVIDVIVISDRVKEIRDVLARTLPTASVTVTSTDSGGTIILGGTVLTVDDMRSLQKLVPDGAGIINNVRIGGVQQVQLEVVVAIVNRSEARNMAFSWNVNGPNWFLSSLVGGPGGLTSSITTGPGATTASLIPLNANANIPFGVVNANGSFMGYFQALRTEGVVKLLAEPRLTTLSGRPARIQSGGTVNIVSSGAGTSAQLTSNFGTIVNFLPIVLGNGKIHLEVSAEVSNPTDTIPIPGAGAAGTVSFSTLTRTATATVQIDDGQTLAMGGLIQNTVNAKIARVPVLGDLPYLGVLFTSKTFTETEEEIIILVTPRLVDPVDCTKIPKYLPGRETRSPDDFELFLEGILEAPRGPRNVVFHPHLYKAAYHGAPNIGQIPCADGSCNQRGGVGCANGNCGPSGNVRPALYTTTLPAPSFPDAQLMPSSNYRVTTEQEMPSPAPMPPIRSVPGLGPVSPTPMPPAREFENRRTLPPVFEPR